MEEPQLFGDIYDIVTCYVLIIIGLGLFIYSFVSGQSGFRYGGAVLIAVFAGLLLFSYYARYKNMFTRFAGDLKSISVTILVVLLILATLISVIVLVM
jgi:asparagine N-glycosylation enzyme membrane subunit Stt3